MADIRFLPDVIFNSPAPDEDLAFLDARRAVTYGDARHEISLLASSLLESGLAPGDRVCVMHANSWGYVRSIFAVSRAGLIPAVFHPRSGSADIPRLMEIAKPSGILIDEKIMKRLADALDIHFSGMIFTGIYPETNITPHKTRAAELPEPEIRYSDPDDGALIIFTTGTTGPPKGVYLSHRNVLSVARKVVDAFCLRSDDRTLVAASLSHVSSFTSQMIAYPMAGASCYIASGYLTSPTDVIEFARAHDITTIQGMITSVLMIRRSLDPVDNPFPNLRLISVGGMRVTRSMLDEIIEGFPGTKIFNSYGLTEASPRMTAFRIDDKPEMVDSVGPPWSICEVEVVDENDNFLPRGKVGELLVKSPGCMKGYFNDLDATEAAFVRGWMRTGDLACVDDEGNIHIESRINEMINVAGEKVNPYEVEDAITCMEGVRECLVAKLSDDVMGDVPIALVIRHDGVELACEDIRDALREQLASFKIPREIRFVDEFPTTKNGKLIRVLPE